MAEYNGDGRIATARTQGVWTTCDECGEDWWCVVGERDYLDEPISWICSDGCDDEDDLNDYDDHGDMVYSPGPGRTRQTPGAGSSATTADLDAGARPTPGGDA